MTMLADIGTSLRSFLVQLTTALQFDLLFAISLAVEVFFVFLFILRVSFSYEMRLRRSIDKANNWLFKNKKLDQSNIKEFNNLLKKGPKRLSYYWQQFILFREGEPTMYLSLDNLVEKPLKTSGFANGIKNLNIFTSIWAAVTLFLGFAYITDAGAGSLSADGIVYVLIIPLLVLFIGLVASMIMRSRKISNLDDIYHVYHIFARFINNACVDLPPYIDYDLLFSAKEIEKGNPQLREYYESRARKAKEEFEKAKQSDVDYVEYNFRDAGVDGSLVLERAMKESETFMNKKTNALAKIAHVEAQQEALKRNYENVQKDLQKKIQASKENIQKLIQQQEATTNRMEVGFLRKQQEQEISKQESLQNEYDQEDTRFRVSNEELNQEIKQLTDQLDQAKDDVERAMVNEYQSFYEKIMKNAYQLAEKRVAGEKSELVKERDQSEKELIVVQTQVKRLIDENNTLRAQLNMPLIDEKQNEQNPKGEYDKDGNYVYADGSYHDPNGLFHDVDGKIYDINGTLIREPEDDIQNQTTPLQQEQSAKEEQPAEEIAQPEVVDLKENADVKVEDVTAEELGLDIVPVMPMEIVAQPSQQEAPKEAKKRGRPKKPAEEKVVKEVKKRGRPKKEEGTKYETFKTGVVYLSEKDGVPKVVKTEKKKRPASRVKKAAATTTKAKTSTKSNATKKTSGTKATATPTKKSTKTATKTTASKPRTTRKKKDDLDLVSLAKINKLITEEENRLSKMKALVNNEISDALNTTQEREIIDQREEIMNAVEELKNRAEKAKEEGKSEQELASINNRLEALIKEISDLNKK